MISIIIPIYNKEKHIKKCIDSILKQTYNDYEIILVNDGSTDNSLNVCKENYSNYNNIKIINQSNHGVSTARNVGLSNSDGEYIVFIDADDEIEENYLEELFRNVYNYEMTICGCHYFIESKNKKLTKLFNDNTESQTININELIKVSRRGLLNALWNKIFKKSIIVENNIKFIPEISLGEDLLFIIEYLKHIKTEIYVINKPLYNYSLREEGINLSSKETIEERIDRILYTKEKFKELYKINNIEELTDIYNKFFEEIILVIGRYSIKYKQLSMMKKRKILANIIDKQKFRELLEQTSRNFYAYLIKHKFTIIPYIMLKLIK